MGSLLILLRPMSKISSEGMTVSLVTGGVNVAIYNRRQINDVLTTSGNTARQLFFKLR